MNSFIALLITGTWKCKHCNPWLGDLAVEHACVFPR